MPVVAPEFSDPDGKRAVELAQKRQARALVQPAIEPQDTKPRAVIEGGVLKGPAAGDLHEFHVDLNAFARLRLLEQLHLPGGTRFGVRRRRARPISRKIRWIVPTAMRTSWTRRNHSWGAAPRTPGLGALGQ